MTIQGVLRAVALDIQELRTHLNINSLQRDRVDVGKWANIADQLANCANAVAHAYSVDDGFTGSGIASSAVTCANSIAQIGFALATADIDTEVLRDGDTLNWIDFRRRFEEHATNLQNASTELQKTTLALQGGLASIEADRQTSLRNIGRAMLLDSDSSGRYMHLNTGMRPEPSPRFRHVSAGASYLRISPRNACSRKIFS